MESLSDWAHKGISSVRSLAGPNKVKRIRKTAKAAKSYLKGSRKDPLLYLGTLAVALLAIIAFVVPSTGNLNALASLGPSYQSGAFLTPTQQIKESPELTLVGGDSLAAVSPPMAVTPQVLGALADGSDYNTARKDILKYTVQNGDSLWGIAQKFNISIDTVVWANDLGGVIIQPGQTLLILPVSGVMHKVVQGDTISAIASTYEAKASDIIAFNDIVGNTITDGQTLIIPDGRMPSYSSVSLPSSASVSNLSTNNFYGQSHAYPFGQCTWWVAQQRAIPSWGNAIDWLPNAAAQGWKTCTGRYCVPKAGAVAELMGDKLYGHVGYVEEVLGNKIKISEMNYIGWGEVDYRWIEVGDPVIKGYIY